MWSLAKGFYDSASEWASTLVYGENAVEMSSMAPLAGPAPVAPDVGDYLPPDDPRINELPQSEEQLIGAEEEAELEGEWLPEYANEEIEAAFAGELEEEAAEFEEAAGLVAEFRGVAPLEAPPPAFGSPEYIADLAAREAEQAAQMGEEGVEMVLMRVPLGALDAVEELAEESAAIAIEGSLGLMAGLSGAAAVAGAFAPGILTAFGIYLVNLANQHEAQFEYDLERRTLSDSGEYMGNLAYILVGKLYMPCYVNGQSPQTFDIKYKDITGFPREVTIEILDAMTDAFLFLSLQEVAA